MQVDSKDKQYDNDTKGFEERIDKSTLVPLNDPNCQHSTTRTPATDMPGYDDVHCHKCHVGWFVLSQP